MRSLSALLVIGFVAVSALQPYSWTPSKEYRYKYSSQVLTGIPELNSQYSGLRISSTVRIQPQHDSTCRIQLEEPRLTTYNGELEWERDWKPTSGHEQGLSSQIKTWLETPFTVFHKRGLVEKLETENGEPEFIVNLKKGLVSQLQMDLSKTSELNINQVQRGDSQEVIPVFETHETSVLGKCETVYTISKLPQHMVAELERTELVRDSHCEGKEHFEILKTKNLDNCVNRPVYHATFGVWPKSDGSRAFSFPVHSSVTRTIVCGSLENHYIRKSVTKNKILVGATEEFETKEQIDVSSISTLELESVQGIQREIPQPSSPKGFPSLVYEYPSGSATSSRSMKQEISGQGKPGQQAPLPDLTSAPQGFFANTESQRELKQKVVEIFTEMIESTKDVTESIKSKKDVAGLSVEAAKIISMLSLEELKEVEQTLMSQVGRSVEHSLVKKVFFDLVSISGTNPCIMLIKEKVRSGEIMHEPSSWSLILSNALRNVKTPTPELLKELVELLKTEHIQRNRLIRAAYTMGLTDLINKACINPESKVNQFPYRIYGQMCHKEMEVIKNELIPYLTEKLQQSSKSDMNTVITYIYGLGNLGVEESSHELLKVVEGEIPTHHYVKALAVYKLIRPAMTTPSLYRPIFMSIIENPAENPQVRMAAITALIYASPSSADLQKLAVRTWYEPSKQVSSYIYTTLWSLSKLSEAVPEYDSIVYKAQSVLPMAKPTKEGIQYSHNIQYTTFVETLKTALSQKWQWVASEDSFIPRTIYAKSELLTQSRNVELMETMLYMQGSETLLKQLSDLVWEMGRTRSQGSVSENEREVEEIVSKLGIRNKHNEKPEAHLYMKFLGQQLYTVDEELIERVVRKLSTEFVENISELERGMNFEYMKVLDLYGGEWSVPTETGLPVYITVKHPMVGYKKGQLKAIRTAGKLPVFEVEMKGAFNIKRQVRVGITTPLTERTYGTGLETTISVAAPLKIELGVSEGQVRVTVKEWEHQQGEQATLEYDVHPFTYTKEMNDFTLASKCRDSKTIRSRSTEIEKEIQIGRPLGLDIKARITTEETGLDLYQLIGNMKSKLPAFISSLSTPIGTGKRTHIKIVHNPTSSEVKEFDLFFTVEGGIKKDSRVSYMLTPSHHNVEVCKEKQRSCEQHMERQNLPRHQVERICEKEFEICYHSVETKKQLQHHFGKFDYGYGVGISMGAILRGRETSEERKIESFLTVAHKPEGHGLEQTYSSWKVAVKSPMLRQPWEIKLNGELETKKPVQKWNWEEILRETLTSKVLITGEYGMIGEQKQEIKGSLELVQSEKQKEFVRRSEQYHKCSRQQSEGELLTESCKELRHMAASLDAARGRLTLPTHIAESRITEYVTDIAKIAVLPYLTQRSIGSRQSGSHQEYEIEARVSGHGDLLNVKIAGNGEEVEVKNVRLGRIGKALFPICTKETLPVKLIQKLTSNNLPSSCIVEAGKVKTFDKYEYTYPLNDCEQVVFSERSSRPRVLVTTRKDQVKQHIKMVVDGHKVEVEINKESRYSRDATALIKINGQRQQWSSLERKMIEEEIFISHYLDGVYSLYSPKYGVEVVADGKRLEVKSPQFIFRNRVTGICGDMNGEWSAELKSAKQCITTKPKLSAYSFLIEDGKCQGIPQQLKSEYEREEQRCIKEEELPTKVTSIFRQLQEFKPQSELTHTIKEFHGKTCFSKELIRVCPRSHPQEVRSKQVGFVCITGPKVEILKERVLSGDLVEEFEYLPTQFVKTVYEPKHC